MPASPPSTRRGGGLAGLPGIFERRRGSHAGIDVAETVPPCRGAAEFRACCVGVRAPGPGLPGRTAIAPGAALRRAPRAKAAAAPFRRVALLQSGESL